MKIKVVIYFLLFLTIKIKIFSQITDEELKRYLKYLSSGDIRDLQLVSKKYNQIEKKYKYYLESKLDTMKNESVDYCIKIGKWYEKFLSKLWYEEEGLDVNVKIKNRYLYFSGAENDRDTVFIFVNNKFYLYFIPFIPATTNFHVVGYKIPFKLKKVVKISVIHVNEKIEFYWSKEAKMVKISYFENLDPKWYVLFTNYGFDIY